MLFRGQIVPEHQVQLILPVPHSRNRRDGIVRHALGLGENNSVRIRISAPRVQNAIRECNEASSFLCRDAHHRHRPVHNARTHIFKAREREFRLNRRPLHGETVVTALEVIVREDGASHNRQIRIRSHEVMRELMHKVEQLRKSIALYLHRRVLAVKTDAVLVVIDIGRILQKPRLFVDCNRHNAEILPRGMVYTSRIALILRAKKTARIVRGRKISCRRYVLRILFGLGEIDADIHLPVCRVHLPSKILCTALAANVVHVLTERIIPIRCRLRTLRIQRFEARNDLGRTRCQAPHKFRVKEIPVGHRVLGNKPLFVSVITEDVQSLRKPGVLIQFKIRQRICIQYIEKGIERPNALTVRN